MEGEELGVGGGELNEGGNEGGRKAREKETREGVRGFGKSLA